MTTPANKKAAQPPATVDWGEHDGAGFDNMNSNDLAIPFAGLLQDLSPEVREDDEKYIKGAKPGLYFNTVTQELIGPDLYVVPVHRDYLFVEWVPRDSGGGFVGIHDPASEVVQKARANSASFNKLKTEAGNDLIETYYLYCLLLDGPDATESVSPIVLAFTSTKIKVYKRLMTRLRTVKGKPPLYAFRLKFGSVGEKNRSNQPYKNYTVEATGGSLADPESMNLPGSPREQLLNEATSLMDAVRSGAARAATESSEGTAEKGDGEEPF